MLREKRQSQILQLLKQDGGVEINKLCKMFNVSDATIRRDLETLSLSHNIIRTHGGAIINPEDQITELAYDRRILAQENEKEAIAKKALEFISYGNTIYIDSGTTTYCMAKCLPFDSRNVIITNGINIASEIINRDYASPIMIGGDLKRTTHSTRGALAEEQLKKFKMDIAFLGCNAIDNDGNVYIANTLETGLKKIVIESSKNTYILCDSSKFNKTNLISYTHASKVSGIIVDNKLPKDTASKLESKGVNIIIAE